MISKNCARVLVASAVVALFVRGAQADRLYVDAGVTGGLQNGSDWQNAYADLEGALSAASTNGLIDEIWVAQGVYLPSRPSTPPYWYPTFQLLSEVSLYGGFSGVEALLEERNFVNNPTVLSGDLGIPGVVGDNAAHVVTGSGVDATAVLDGFIIRDGHATGPVEWDGGGLLNLSGSPTLRNCTFVSNNAGDRGGAVFSDELSQPSFSGCFFTSNGAGDGGAVYDNGSDSLFVSCSFSANVATLDGGAVFNYQADPQMIGCEFVGNGASSDGGAIANEGNSSPRIVATTLRNNLAGESGGGVHSRGGNGSLVNCLLAGNEAGHNGGGLADEDGSVSTITNCTVAGNTATLAGGGLYVTDVTTVTNCIAWGNSDNAGSNSGETAQISSALGSPVALSYSCVEGCSYYCSGGYAGNYNIGDDPLLMAIVLALGTGSPAINAGNNVADTDVSKPGLQPIPPVDLAGNPRIVADTVDLGAYEKQDVCSNGEECDDHNACTVGDVCSNGICEGVPVDCTTSGSECGTAECNPGGDEGNCDTITPINEGGDCDDSNPCTVADACSNGTCVGDAVDCSHLDTECGIFACDPIGTNGNCDSLTAINEGQGCDDGDVCNVGETCQAGTCSGGNSVDCSAFGDDCNTAVCNSNGIEGNCEFLIPVDDGELCDDGDPCTEGDSCTNGFCAGVEVDCTPYNDQCNIASCNTNGPDGNCEVMTPFNEGGTCDDGNPCTVNDTCTNGICMGSVVDCSMFSDDCVEVSCDPNGGDGNCDKLTPINEGLPCQNDNPCVVNETCQSGECTGPIVDCSALDTECASFSCDSNGAPENCSVLTPINEGGDCDDSNPCTVADACSNGTCIGDAVDCSHLDTECGIFACDPIGTNGNCDSLTAINEGQGCDDGDVCNVGETCQAGTCSGGNSVDCSAFGDDCNTAVCNSNGIEGNCEFLIPVDDGELCDDGDPCTEGDSCTNGLCAGVEVDCTPYNDQCNIASCNTNGPDGNCEVMTPFNEGGTCDDGNPCTVNDTCTNGICMGSVVDCSMFNDDCVEVSCDPNGGDGNCDKLTPINEGLPCQNDNPCVVNETCQSGECTGPIVDCSALDTECASFSCDSNGAPENCDLLTPVNDGLPCEGSPCTVDETCQAGTCSGGSPVDCTPHSSYCLSVSCDTNGVEGNCDIEVAINEGVECDNGDPCTLNDVCSTGLCVGTLVDCEAQSTQCAVASCDPIGSNGNCSILTAVDDGEFCDDGDPCTTADACSGGLCVGVAVDCSAFDGQCFVASCDPVGTNGNCDTHTAANEGLSCDDNDVCTANDVCSNGTCAGTVVDTDGDGVPDCEDNCVTVYNPAQGDDCDLPPNVLCVKYDAVGDNDGSSWYNAFNKLQDALATAAGTGGAVDEIWVAAGQWEYRPDESAGRSATFQLVSGVAVYGGFSGTELSRSERNPAGKRTILSGDIGVLNVSTDNCYHVITGTGADESAILENFTITQGAATGPGAGNLDVGGGLIYKGTLQDDTGPTIINCTFLANTATANGGGVWSDAFPESGVTLINCVFIGNSAVQYGGGAYARRGTVNISNCTFHRNLAGTYGGGFYTEVSFDFSGCPSNSTVANSVFWHNIDSTGVGQEAQIRAVDSYCAPEKGLRNSITPLSISNCCIQGWLPDTWKDINATELNNFGDDPLFVDTNGLDDVCGTLDDDVSLAYGSPCVDTGDNSLIHNDVADLNSNGITGEPTPIDLAGTPRIVNTTVDRGAYEHKYDCNNNGVIDFDDVMLGTSQDCNTNGRPDECETDCNNNGVPDDCDISSGTSGDCNTNSIPDECDIALSTSTDCNTNGIPDACDVAHGSSTDCNWNGVSDACDILLGTSEDCNDNEIPDECELRERFFILDNASSAAESRLVEFNLLTGASTTILVLPQEGNDRGLTILPGSNELLVTDHQNRLINRVDTRQRIIVNTISVDLPILELAYDWRRSTLFGTADDGYLYAIDLDSGTLTQVMTLPGLGPFDWVCLGYDRQSDRLFGASKSEQRIYAIDVATQTSTAFQETLDVGVMSDIVVDPSSGMIYGTNESGDVYLIDRPTGETTLITEVQSVGNTAAGIAASFRTATDCNINTVPDECDVAGSTSQDCNSNGLPDDCDLNAGTSSDVNANGVPDECDADCNDNGVPDDLDIGGGTSQDCNSNLIADECEVDCNGNGIPDDCDVVAGSSNDCNGNLIPDECEEDCNTNSIPDDCDIAEGSSADCNTNGMPDECELTAGTAPDCNTNSVPDECDIASDSSHDCNLNGIPDECDIVAGTSTDCNETGIPDSCELLTGGDFNGDGAVNLVDFGWWPDCQSGPGKSPSPPAAECSEACTRAFDMDSDGDVDLEDFAAMQLVFD